MKMICNDTATRLNKGAKKEKEAKLVRRRKKKQLKRRKAKVNNIPHCCVQCFSRDLATCIRITPT